MFDEYSTLLLNIGNFSFFDGTCAIVNSEGLQQPMGFSHLFEWDMHIIEPGLEKVWK